MERENNCLYFSREKSWKGVGTERLIIIIMRYGKGKSSLESYSKSTDSELVVKVHTLISLSDSTAARHLCSSWFVATSRLYTCCVWYSDICMYVPGQMASDGTGFSQPPCKKNSKNSYFVYLQPIFCIISLHSTFMSNICVYFPAALVSSHYYESCVLRRTCLLSCNLCVCVCVHIYVNFTWCITGDPQILLNE